MLRPAVLLLAIAALCDCHRAPPGPSAEARADDARSLWCAHVRDAYCGRCGCTDLQRAGVLTSCRVMVSPRTVARGSASGMGDPACRAAVDAMACAETGLPDVALPEACR